MEAKLLPDSFNPLFFDAKVTHFVQSWAWGDVRKKTGVKILRIGFFEGNTLANVAQLTLHKLPKVNKYLALLSKCAVYSKQELDELVKIGKAHNIIAIRLEPDAESNHSNFPDLPNLQKAPRNYYIPHNFLVDLTKSEEELLAAMHQKTRYNVKVAQKHGVTVEENTDEATQEAFINLQQETAARQKFYLHPDSYYRAVFQILIPQHAATFLVAKHPDGTVLTIWFLVFFKKTITYLYGASSNEHKHLMANNLVAWEAMRLGKARGMDVFDFGGTLGTDATLKDPRFGFHKFKEGFGGRHVDYLGTFDLIIDRWWYALFTSADALRWKVLRLLKH